MPPSWLARVTAQEIADDWAAYYASLAAAAAIRARVQPPLSYWGNPPLADRSQFGGQRETTIGFQRLGQGTGQHLGGHARKPMTLGGVRGWLGKIPVQLGQPKPSVNGLVISTKDPLAQDLQLQLAVVEAVAIQQSIQPTASTASNAAAVSSTQPIVDTSGGSAGDGGGAAGDGGASGGVGDGSGGDAGDGGAGPGGSI